MAKKSKILIELELTTKAKINKEARAHASRTKPWIEKILSDHAAKI